MTRKDFGVVRGKCFAIGDEVSYHNRHGQAMRGVLVALFVEQPGLCGIKRPEWRVEFIDLSDETEYPIVRLHQRQLKIGQAVHVVKEIGRRSRIAEVKANELGTVLYVLQDGGWFSTSEIEAA